MSLKVFFNIFQTISQILSPKDIFTQEDIELINIVDSADFAKYDITPSDVMNYLFKIDRERDVRGNKRMMGLVANKLLLAFKINFYTSIYSY